ncbi:MAG: hypothetical protein WKG03_13520 [Telluria sp.]
MFTKMTVFAGVSAFLVFASYVAMGSTIGVSEYQRQADQQACSNEMHKWVWLTSNVMQEKETRFYAVRFAKLRLACEHGPIFEGSGGYRASPAVAALASTTDVMEEAKRAK